MRRSVVVEGGCFMVLVCVFSVPPLMEGVFGVKEKVKTLKARESHVICYKR